MASFISEVSVIFGKTILLSVIFGRLFAFLSRNDFVKGV